jgi:outer membrane protein assembly factor BamB
MGAKVRAANRLTGARAVARERGRASGFMRGLLLVSLASAAPALAWRCGLTASAAEDPATAMFRGGPAHAGVYGAAGAPELGGVRWRVATEGPVRSSPAVAGGRVYFGSGDGRVYAVDLDGREVWKADLEAAVTSSPAVAEGHVFAQSRSGEVVALAAASGAVAWRFKTGADVPFAWGHESGDAYVSSPVVAAGKVVVGSGDGRLYALDARSGHPVWQLATGGRVRSSPAVAGGVVFAGSMDGSLYAVELATGRLKWRFDTLGRSLRSATYGFDRKSVQSSPAVVEGTVYVGGRDGFLYAIDAETGAEKWRFDHQVSWVISSPAVWDGKVYAGSSDGGFLQAVDARTGREAWRIQIPAIVWSSPAIAGTTLYAGDGDGVLHAVDARTGRQRWTYRLGAGILGSPVPVGETVLVGSNDGTLYALGAGSGGLLRRIVFWDTAYERAAWLRGHTELRDYLAAHGYQVMDARALATFMEAAIADHGAARSVVAFAIDHLPAELAVQKSGKALLRRYLEAHGKVVWTGFPPLIWPRDPKTGRMAPYDSVDRRAPQELLGVDFTAANFDSYGTRVTAAGRAWGLRGWWLAPWSVPPAKELEVLALEENGLAAAWVRRFGGEPGTGFVMIGRAAAEPATVLAAGDYRPSAAGGH